MAAKAEIEPIELRTGDRVTVRGHRVDTMSGESWLYPAGTAPDASSPPSATGLRLHGIEAHGPHAIEVTGVWRDGVVDVELVSADVAVEVTFDPDRALDALRDHLRHEASPPLASITDATAALVIGRLQDHPDVVRITQVTIAPGLRVLVVAARSPSQVALMVNDALSAGHVVVVGSQWSRAQVDHARDALHALPIGEIIRGGEGITERGEPFLFAYTRRPLTIRYGLSPELVRIRSWITLAPV